MAEGQFQQIGDFVFDVFTRTLWRAGEQIQLHTNERNLLAALVKRFDRIYTNENLEKDVWEARNVGPRLHGSASKLRDVLGDGYITLNQRPIRLKKRPQPLPSWYRPDFLDELPRLTLSEPKDDSAAQRLWLKATDHKHNRALHDLEWAWIFPFSTPTRIQDFSLSYHEDWPRYEDTMPPLAQEGLQWWRETQRNENKIELDRLQAEPLGLQVRLVGMHFEHYPTQKYRIDLAPAKFLHYVAIQQNLWKPELHSLRQHAFQGGVNKEMTFLLPSPFAIHMAAVSKDGKALLRQRSSDTPLYPLAWEAGSGELMHGPEYTKANVPHLEKSEEHFAHFNAKGEPDLSWYLRNTVLEELSYKGAKDEDFRIYGLAVEYRTLAPKLIVVYQSDALIDQLIDGANRSPERPHDTSAIDLSVDEMTKSFTDGQYPTWGPTSKLALLLALVQRDGENQVKEVQARMDELAPLPTN